MVNIVQSFVDDREVTTITQEDVSKAARSAIEAIKNELPEEAQTVEGVECVISEMRGMVNGRRVVL